MRQLWHSNHSPYGYSKTFCMAVKRFTATFNEINAKVAAEIKNDSGTLQKRSSDNAEKNDGILQGKQLQPDGRLFASVNSDADIHFALYGVNQPTVY